MVVESSAKCGETRRTTSAQRLANSRPLPMYDLINELDKFGINTSPEGDAK